MAVVPLHLDPNAEARALLYFMLQHGDIVGTDHAGRTILQLAVDPWTLVQLAAFDADAADLEDADGEPEPDRELEGPAVVLDLVPPKRIRRTMRATRAVALALLLVALPSSEGTRADQAAATTGPLPMSTAQQTEERPAQCCRMCRKGKACGDGCISAERQCRKESGCACSAPASDS
jgi:hypothetical protein